MYNDHLKVLRLKVQSKQRHPESGTFHFQGAHVCSSCLVAPPQLSANSASNRLGYVNTPHCTFHMAHQDQEEACNLYVILSIINLYNTNLADQDQEEDMHCTISVLYFL